MSDAVWIVGAGPAGLTAATALAGAGVPVVVVEREGRAGGVPRHCDHPGFGWHETRRVLDGPAYARHLVAAATDAGVPIRTSTMVTGWTGDGGLQLTGPGGVEAVRAAAVVLATGCRERPRAARLVPGARPSGVLTTGALQQLVQGGRFDGRRAVVIGAEHVSLSAVATLRHAGCAVAGLATEHDHHQTFAPFAAGLAVRYRVPIWTGCRLRSIEGADRVSGVRLHDGRSGTERRVACDTVVFTGDWIADHELLTARGAAVRATTPEVDQAWRTTVPGVFAAGNVVHPAETAGVCARDGRAVAAAVQDHLRGARWSPDRVALHVEPPLQWIWPAAVSGAAPPSAGGFVLRSGVFARSATLRVRQGDRQLLARRVRRVVPARPLRLDAGWCAHVDASGPPVTVALS